MMYSKILIAVIACIEIVAIKAWFSCRHFADSLYFSSFDLKLKVEEQVHNDVGYTPEIVRFFHNKVFMGYTELLKKYLFFWESNFQALFFSIIGSFGILCGLWYVINSKQRRLYKWSIIVVLAMLPVIEIFSLPLPYLVRVILLWLPYAVFSLYGLWQFLSHNRQYGWLIVSVLSVISIWYLWAFQGDIFAIFCYNK